MRRLSSLTLLAVAVACTCARTPAGAAEPPLAASNRALLQSDGWQQLMHEFDEWASVQKLYDRSQTDKFRTQIIEKASTLPADQLQAFGDDLAERLEILSSAEARSARQWLTQTLSVASDSYAKKVKAKYPDIATLTASQLQEKLDEFEANRATARKSSTDFVQARQAQVKLVEAQRQSEEAANTAARQASSGSYSGYNPGVTRVGVTVRNSSSRYRSGWGGYRW